MPKAEYRPDEPVLTRDEVASAYGVCPHTVKRWVKLGRVATVKNLRGRRVYPVAALPGMNDARRKAIDGMLKMHNPIDPTYTVVA